MQQGGYVLATTQPPLWVLPAELPPSTDSPSDPRTAPELPGLRSSSTERLVLLPTLNEEEGLELTLRDLLGTRFLTPYSAPSILVIDGRSTDRTRQVAKSWGVPILDQHTKGKGAAVREGLEWARSQHFGSVAVMDADGTYPTSSLPALFHLLDSGRHLVVGVRRPEWAPTRSARDMIHRVGNGLLNYAAAQFSGELLLDICSGFWGVRTEAIGRLSIQSDGFEIESELFINAFRAGLDVAQFPIVYRERVGEAKLHAVRDGARIFLSIIRHSLKPVRSASVPTAELVTPVATSEDLDLLLLSLAPRMVVFRATPGRMVEAADHARRLNGAIPHVEVTTEVLGSEGIPQGHPVFRSPRAPADVDGPPSLIVTLPGMETSALRNDHFLVEKPRSQRLIRVAGTRTADSGSPRPSPPVTPGFRKERLPGGRLAALFILSATVEESDSLRELALLAANRRDPSTEVYRRSRPDRQEGQRGLSRLKVPFVRFLGPSNR